MTLKAALTPLIIAVTAGGADAFAQGSVNTGLAGSQAYNVRLVTVEFLNAISIVDASEVEIAITRRSKAAMPNIGDSDVLFKFRWQAKLATSGAAMRDKVLTVAVPAELEVPIVEETIYAQVDGTATGVIGNVVVRLECALDTMSDINRLNLIARSLT